MEKIEELRLRAELATLDCEWHDTLEPSPLGFTVNNYHRWPLQKLSHVVAIQDRMKEIKWILFKLWWKRLWLALQGVPTPHTPIKE